MLKIAITGNIASGKSLVEDFLIKLGYKVIDSDKIVHNILENDNKTIKKIKELFSTDDILNVKGNISRDKLGKVVFSNIEKKKALEKIIHIKVKEKIDNFFELNKEEKFVFVSVPLLFEANFDKFFDKIIFISAPEDIRLSRLINRNKYSIEYAKKRIQSQAREEDKIKKSDFVIYNKSDLKTLEEQTKDILTKLN